jgi:hypothetical protein
MVRLWRRRRVPRHGGLPELRHPPVRVPLGPTQWVPRLPGEVTAGFSDPGSPYRMLDLAMSALPSEADIRAGFQHICFGPHAEQTLSRISLDSRVLL